MTNPGAIEAATEDAGKQAKFDLFDFKAQTAQSKGHWDSAFKLALAKGSLTGFKLFGLDLKAEASALDLGVHDGKAELNLLPVALQCESVVLGKGSELAQVLGIPAQYFDRHEVKVSAQVKIDLVRAAMHFRRWRPSFARAPKLRPLPSS